MGDLSATATRGDERPVVSIGEVFVSIELDRPVAHVAYESRSAIRWEEVSRADAELLVRMGARADMQLRSVHVTTGREERGCA